jgi:hypothetical protein
MWSLFRCPIEPLMDAATLGATWGLVKSPNVCLESSVVLVETRKNSATEPLL